MVVQWSLPDDRPVHIGRSLTGFRAENSMRCVDRFRLGDFAIGAMLVGVGVVGFMVPPSLPDSPVSMVTALLLSLAYSAAIGAGLLAPFKLKVRGAVIGVGLIGVIWIYALIRG